MFLMSEWYRHHEAKYWFLFLLSVAEKDKSMSFAVVCAERTFHFQAHNRDDLNEWLAHLEARGAFLLK